MSMFQVQVSLHVSDRENIPDLWTKAENPRPEASKNRGSNRRFLSLPIKRP
jgi:hypothetical protein